MELEHRYGDHVHILSEPYLLTLLARIGSPDTGTRDMPRLVRAAYVRLAQTMLGKEFPVIQDRVTTRMASTEPRGFYEGERLCQNTKLIFVAVIRAGILPAEACYEAATEVLPQANVRLDFVNMSRVTDDDGHVTGVRMDGSKIGGPVDDAIIVVADPMGATGSTLIRTAQAYREFGTPRRIVGLHLMVTPEFVRNVSVAVPSARIWTARLDRGLSSPAALAAVPGQLPDEERGLNDVQYIVPGAGGMGELLTNAWV